MSALDFSITLDSANVNQLFADFRMMDIQLQNHRKGISRIDDSDLEKLKTRRWHFHQVMMILNLMDDYTVWCHAMGID